MKGDPRMVKDDETETIPYKVLRRPWPLVLCWAGELPPGTRALSTLFIVYSICTTISEHNQRLTTESKSYLTRSPTQTATGTLVIWSLIMGWRTPASCNWVPVSMRFIVYSPYILRKVSTTNNKWWQNQSHTLREIWFKYSWSGTHISMLIQ